MIDTWMTTGRSKLETNRWPLVCSHLTWCACCILYSLLEDSTAVLAPPSALSFFSPLNILCGSFSLTHPGSLVSLCSCFLGNILTHNFQHVHPIGTPGLHGFSKHFHGAPGPQTNWPVHRAFPSKAAWLKVGLSLCHPNPLLLLLRNLGSVPWSSLMALPHPTIIGHHVSYPVDCSSQVPLGLVSFLSFPLLLPKSNHLGSLA